MLKPRRGCFVAELTEQDLDEIFPVMALLEGRCAFDAVRKAKPQDLKRLDDIHARLEKYAAAGDIERYYEQNYTFHEAVQKTRPELPAALNNRAAAVFPRVDPAPASGRPGGHLWEPASGRGGMNADVRSEHKAVKLQATAGRIRNGPASFIAGLNA